MNNACTKDIHSAVMSNKDFCRLSEFVYSECGIKITGSKKVLLESRLRKRLRDLGIGSFSEYRDYLFSQEGINNELIHMIDVVTTNKTDFFREPKHFEYLVQMALPELINKYGTGVRRKYAIWSAGCSTGEEPYTLAMVLSEFAESYQKIPLYPPLSKGEFSFSILATDISTRALEKARLGIYNENTIYPVPTDFRKKYFLKSRDNDKRLVRVVPELRDLVKFRRLNFMDGDFGMREPMDIIFCRNVIIYFDRPTQEKLLNRLYRHLIPGGYMFMGHSETLNGLNVPLISVAPMVYRRPL
ncbi:MAG: protein-glutamate O-methyltransferase [Nitrospirae bacterium]|nr:protein-glutamate O-methyltransferase [Nitrospirota bacterium]